MMIAAIVPDPSLPKAAAQPQADRPLLVYLHGRIIEDQGTDAVSDRFGPYDYDAIVARFEAAGFEVLAPVRGPNPDIAAAADDMVTMLRKRIDAGLLPGNITVVGASKGASIAMLIADRLGEWQSKTVLLAGCAPAVLDWAEREDIALRGHVLAIRDLADNFSGSCAPLFARSPHLMMAEELDVGTGLGHGLLYRPLNAWVAPTIAWARRGKGAAAR